MTESINIHPDFRKMPAMRPAGAGLVAAMNRGLQLAAAFKWFKFREIVTQYKITGLDGGSFPACLIKPKSLQAESPLLIYFHGSGFMVKHVPQHIENAVRYAEEANCCVLFVDYRLAPKYRFPIPFDDCYTALNWALENAVKFGIDKSRIAIGGDSAGGALAACVTQKAVHDDKISICGQLLVYPITDSSCKTFSSTAFANVPPFKQFSMPAVWETYLGQWSGTNPPPYASPMHGNLMKLPPAYVETEEYDPWRDEGVVYAKSLVANGVDVELNEIKGTLHGFDAFAPNSSIVQAAIARRVQFLRRIFR